MLNKALVSPYWKVAVIYLSVKLFQNKKKKYQALFEGRYDRCDHTFSRETENEMIPQ